MTHEELWQAVLGEIELTLSKASFVTWFKNTKVEGIEADTITVSVPNIFAKEWLENKYSRTLLDSIRKYYPQINKITCIIGNLEKDKPRSLDSVITQKTTDQPDISGTNTAPNINMPSLSPVNHTLSTPYQQTKPSGIPPSIFNDMLETNLNSRYSYDNYVVGSNNELAYAACRSVAENPGYSYNPLFIYGPVGLGKTHLLQATGNYILKNNPNFKIKYVSMERFANELVDAIQNSRAKEFKNKYIMLDAIILDDVQFLAKKEKTQEEFFHIFESLYQLRKQIILSSDRPPKSIATLEDRLRSRFEGGMIADIGKPDLETRIAIINRKLTERNFSLPAEIVEYLAENIYNNVRELEGALNKIVVIFQLRNQPPTIEDVIEQTKDIISTNKQKGVSVEKIIKSVAEFFEVKPDEVTSRCRKKNLVKPRQIAIYLMRKEIGLSFPEIGHNIGGRDHSTAIYAFDKIEKELSINNVLQDHIKFIKEKLVEY